MSFQDYVTSYFRGFSFYPDVIRRYSKTYKNFIKVLFNASKNNFPITAVLKNGEQRIFYSIRDLGHTSDGFSDLYRIENDLVIINKNNFKNIRFHNALNNGDLYTCFFIEAYDFLPVEGRLVVDIGASIADSSIYFALKGAKKVIALEPYPLNYESAKLNIEENNLTEKISLFNAGCSGNEGEITVNPSQEGPISSLREFKNGKKIPLMSLSRIIKDFDIDNGILKIDCEGCEYDSLLNLSCDELKKFSHILVEYHYGYKNLQEKLEKCGFNIKVISPIYYRRPDHVYSKTFVGEIFAERIS
jgi:FkbM family methyltransferase